MRSQDDPLRRAGRAGAAATSASTNTHAAALENFAIPSPRLPLGVPLTGEHYRLLAGKGSFRR